MSFKKTITSGDNFSIHHETVFDDSIDEVIISLKNPSECCIKRKGDSDLTVIISLSEKNMDSLAIAWINERKLQNVFGGPVGKEYGAPDCDYD